MRGMVNDPPGGSRPGMSTIRKTRPVPETATLGWAPTGVGWAVAQPLRMSASAAAAARGFTVTSVGRALWVAGSSAALGSYGVPPAGVARATLARRARTRADRVRAPSKLFRATGWLRNAVMW